MQDLSSFGHASGAPDARIEIVEFIDFGCTQCARFTETTFASIEDEFIRTGLVRWRTIAFASGRFRHSAFAAEAAECAAEQGKFPGMQRALLARQSEWSTIGSPVEALARIARAANLDGVAFDACVRSERHRARVRIHKTVALAQKIYGTPTFLLPGGGRALGALPLDQFRSLVLAELAAGNTVRPDTLSGR